MKEKVSEWESKLMKLQEEGKNTQETRDKIKKGNEEIKRMKEESERDLRIANEIRLTPRINKQGHKVYIDENGYQRRVQGKELFHRWWFEIKHGRKIKNGYEIHHKDFDKWNNDINNLEEITPPEHFKKHMANKRKRDSS